jgi:predicted nuclease of predicted toxin-antitoxin system
MPHIPPSKQARLHLDENMKPRVAARLRERGFDVTITDEVGLAGASDEEQLAYAAAAHRAIITFDTDDFPRLHAAYLEAGQEHWGIIVSTNIAWYEVAERLFRLLDAFSAEDLRNQFRWLNDFR